MANTFVFDDDEPQSPDPETPAPPASPEPGASAGGSGGNNRNFLIAAGVLGLIVLLTAVCMAVYALYFLPLKNASARATSDANAAASTEMAANDLLTQQAAAVTATLPPSDTPAPTATETLVVMFASATPSEAALDPGTATVQALQTQLAISQQLATGTAAALATAGTPAASRTPIKAVTTLKSGTPGTPGAQLAHTGAGDEYGLPYLFFAAILVVVVILLARRLRQSHQD